MTDETAISIPVVPMKKLKFKERRISKVTWLASGKSRCKPGLSGFGCHTWPLTGGFTQAPASQYPGPQAQHSVPQKDPGLLPLGARKSPEGGGPAAGPGT